LELGVQLQLQWERMRVLVLRLAVQLGVVPEEQREPQYKEVTSGLAQSLALPAVLSLDTLMLM
jgi:hypothetical protein